ncbi:MAG: hypothetical protein OXM61_02970 [Candidatus Poribacteria bacterium]|nr:hypothetical protein [Candidatus Poribacteria bacterium]
MARKPSLTEALNSAGKNEDKPVKQNTSQKTKSEKTPGSSRIGKKLIAGHFDPDVHRQLKQLSVSADTSIQDLLAEALDDLFQKHGVQR